MSAPVREFTAGSALFTRHDARTRRCLDDFRVRLDGESATGATDRELLAAAYYAERLRHHLAGEVRRVVDHEIEWRRVTRPEFADWWIATIRGGTR